MRAQVGGHLASAGSALAMLELPALRAVLAEVDLRLDLEASVEAGGSNISPLRGSAGLGGICSNGKHTKTLDTP